MNTTSSVIPWLPTTSEVAAAEISLAEQVAMMLHQERQVLIVITGRDPGRVSGFLADLTHALSHAETVLRIKAAMDARELYPFLAGQLGLPPLAGNLEGGMQVGERLRAPARNGKYVLVCEAAHSYSDELLEAIRLLNNYPINIVLCGRPLLLRRLNSGPLRNLRQRANYRLSLDETSTFSSLKWPAIFLAVGLLLYLGVRMFSKPAPLAPAVREPPAYARIRPAPLAVLPSPQRSNMPLAPSASESAAPANVAPAPSASDMTVNAEQIPTEGGLRLRWESQLHLVPRR